MEYVHDFNGFLNESKESELNESALEIAGGIVLGIVGLKFIAGVAKTLFGTLKLKAMKDPGKLKELASEIASRAMDKNPLKAALWLTAVKGMIDKGDIKDGFGLLKTAAKIDSLDINKVFEAEGFDLSDDLNEGTNFGDMTAALGGGDDKVFANFFKKAKNGDKFEYAPNGVELDYIANKSQVSQGEIDLEIKQTSRDAKPVVCTVVGKREGVILNGGGMEYEGEEVDAVYFIMGNDKNTIYVLTDTF